MPRIPLHSGSRLPLVTLPDEAVHLGSPPPLDPLADVGAAVAEALRYPLAGPPLTALAQRGGRATVVVQPPSLPLPTAQDDARRDALASVLGELARAGLPRANVTILVAGGLARRADRRALEGLLRRDQARDFRGTVRVHDCESDDLRPVTAGEHPTRVSPTLLDTDLVVCVGAAETVLHGGATALLDASTPGTMRAATAVSLLEATGATGLKLAAALESALGRVVPVLGLSLVVERPQATGLYHGFPWRPASVDAVRRSPFRRLLNAAPAVLRRRALAGVQRELDVVAALAGPPSVAHAEALVRGTAMRSTVVARPFETIVVPLGWEGLHLPREPLNPVTAAALGLGHALRLWRNRPPLVEGGTVILLHPFSRVMGHGPQAPYLTLFAALRDGATPRDLGRVEAHAARDRRAVAAYRSGAAPHPRLPFADWETCRAMLERAGRVIVAGCRDAGAARALGLVPSHNTATALSMAAGLAGPDARTGVILGPPYPALLVSGG